MSGSAASSIRPPKPSASIRRFASAIGVSRSAACTGAQSSGSASATGAAASPARLDLAGAGVLGRDEDVVARAGGGVRERQHGEDVAGVAGRREEDAHGNEDARAARAYSRIRASTSSRRVSMSACETRLSRHRRSSGSVFDIRTLKCQSS